MCLCFSLFFLVLFSISWIPRLPGNPGQLSQLILPGSLHWYSLRWIPSFVNSEREKERIKASRKSYSQLSASGPGHPHFFPLWFFNCSNEVLRLGFFCFIYLFISEHSWTYRSTQKIWINSLRRVEKESIQSVFHKVKETLKIKY